MAEHVEKRTKHKSRLRRNLIILASLVFMLTAWWIYGNTNPTITIPPQPAPPKLNAHDLYLEAERQVSKEANQGAFHITMWNAGQMGFTPAQMEEQLKETRRGARLIRQAFQYQYQLSRERSIEQEEQHGIGADYSHLRDISRYLQFEGDVESAQQRWGEAANSYLDALYFATHIQTNADITGLLVGIKSEYYSRKNFWGVINHLTSDQARTATRRLAAITSKRRSFAAALEEENWKNEVRLMDIFHQPDWRSSLIDAEATDTFQVAHFGVTQITFLNHDYGLPLRGKQTIFSAYTRLMNKTIQRAKLGYIHGGWNKEPQILVFSSGLIDITNPYALLDYTRAYTKYTASLAQNAMLMTAVALRAYYIDHQNYPATLANLTPAYLPVVPADPYADNAPLCYRLRGNQYLLYSIGPDGVDNGGVAISYTYSIRPDATGDIVAGVF